MAPVGFIGPPADGVQHPVRGPVWASLTPPPAAVAWTGAPTAPRRRRWVPAALAGAGVALLLGGGIGGYAVGQAVAGTGGGTGASGQAGQLLVPGDGTSPGGDGSGGGLRGPADGGSGRQGQLGQDPLGRQGDDGTGPVSGAGATTTT